MKRLNLIFGTILLVTVLLQAHAVYGDEPANAAAKGAATTHPLERRMKEVNWDGLPLSEIVNQLRREFPEINFVVTRKVKAETIFLTVRNVTLAELFKALEPATDGRIKITWNPEDEVSARLVVLDAPPRSPSDPSICRAFNLSGFLASKEGKDADMELRTVTEALQQGWMMLREANGDDAEAMPRLSVHKGANLLIVVARPFEMAVANEIISQLQGSAPSTRIALPAEPEHEKQPKATTNAAPALKP